MSMSMSASAPALATAGAMSTGARTFAMSKADIRAKHPPIHGSPDPSSVDGKRRGWLSRNKTCGTVVGESCGAASAMLLNLNNSLKDLETSIEQDTKSLREMDKNLNMMNMQAARLKRKMDEEEAFIQAMSAGGELGKCMKDFEDFMGNVRNSYGESRQRHKNNIDILKKEFGYHPAYKRGIDKSEFTGSYLALHPNPDKMHP
eukprot:TRINITY_DN104581_c0_g1_i1.p1 TRINITY_DN104581_c0_g1~~TRINITY_DN104581_c0_g1_i1.p1  ORF type:complete len:203 (-),score=56.15 TRINITY_DN104581_c0_g1_i1:118-726(-)